MDRSSSGHQLDPTDRLLTIFVSTTTDPGDPTTQPPATLSWQRKREKRDRGRKGERGRSGTEEGGEEEEVGQRKKMGRRKKRDRGKRGNEEGGEEGKGGKRNEGKSEKRKKGIKIIWCETDDIREIVVPGSECVLCWWRQGGKCLFMLCTSGSPTSHVTDYDVGAQKVEEKAKAQCNRINASTLFTLKRDKV
ncbi:hypothetical protein Pmani_036642 [Petrolisthes manimaculis]|uniref:Uncharacterized protein n=1 Tax=Petrolisthes manimaculis TaxID=1843537 RepID=A0AAE1NJR7_9EUCA|nr:hypothetical protein Pmani_036642 [Petrolisthes manimaculis]